MSNNRRLSEYKYIILDYLYKNRGKKFNRSKIFFANKIDTKYAPLFNKAYASVSKSEYVICEEERLTWNTDYFISMLHVKNNMEIVYNNEIEKYFASYDEIYPIDGDFVLAKVIDEKRRSCEIIKILKRTTKHIVGTFVQQGFTTFVIPEDKKRYKFDLYVNASLVSDIPNYSKVEVIIEEYNVGLKPTCRISRTIRNTLAKDEKNKIALLAKHGFSEKFSAETTKASQEIKARISQNYLTGKSKIEEPVFIIDTDRPYELAFSSAKTKDGYDITMFIADIASKIVENSVIDKEASEKGVSCQFIDETTSIFPKELLEDKLLFSPGCKRAAIAFKIHFDSLGNRTDYSVFETIVEPSKAIPIDDINTYINIRNEDFEDSYYSLMDEIFALIDLSECIDKTSLIFKDKYKFVLNNDKIINKKISNIELLIELLKLECEKITSSIFAYSNFPIIHSYYELPSMFSIERLFNHCDHLNIKPTCLLEEKINPNDILTMLQKVDHDTAAAIMTNINKMIGPVKYSRELFYNFQTKTSTCPITNPASNYCSLYNQRLLKRFISKKLFNDNVENSVLTNIDNICTKMSYKEKEKDAAEKEYFNTIIVDKITKDGMTCDALVYSFSPSGVNVLLNNGLYGLVRFDEHGLSDKKFIFEDNGVQKSLFIGDNIVVSFNYFDIQRNRLIFSYVS